MTTIEKTWVETYDSAKRAYRAAGEMTTAGEDISYLVAQSTDPHAVLPNDVSRMVAAAHACKAWCDDVLEGVAAAGYPTDLPEDSHE